MKIDDLKLFVLVVELGGFSSAADALNLPRSNVSRRINDLEKELNINLLTRTTRRLTPTPIGQEYYNSLKDILPELDRAHELVKTQSQSPTGKIKVGLLHEADILLHDVIHSFLHDHPNISLETHLSALGYHDILTYGLDACVHIGAISDSSFIARRVAPIKGKLYATPEYVSKYGRPGSLADLDEHFMVLLRRPDGRLDNHWVFNKGEVTVNSRLVSNSAYYIRHAVFQGDGIGMFAELMMKPFVERGEIIDLLPDHETFFDEVSLVYPRRKGLSFAARLFIDYVLEEVEKIQGLS
ncbi:MULTISPECIES: LysR family transcriptional regulator [Photobacterium]|uniref:LysR family transcriptional regulator n=1 Tax=Photobacterium ganghwense TaxID=320778 RepID=A0A0J1HDX5_9GAMM|nr:MULTISPECIES: LysR family transcriptional regulator [Photobacterium]KLV09828.1 LysR family transcriptional regulator [Photobacterium ganghwense]MBV1839608.1 LysR family transcriptional regulator [Photobacterium ganghwense]PSU09332.1 LysR family transcriptional regulator [Photobacterium ganghwense]QSV16519.1 LysR family transcriptional regulator [Photobacterium ganghwense]